MPRRQSKTTKGQNALAKLAAESGVTFDLSGILGMAQEQEQRGAAPVDMEAEAVLRSLHIYHQFMMKKCKNPSCGAEFMTNFCANNYCSDLCIQEALRAVGIKYDPFTRKRWEHVVSPKDNLRYQWEPPLEISTQTVNQLENFARTFLADLDRIRNVALEQELANLQSQPEPQPESEDDEFPQPGYDLQASPALEPDTTVDPFDFLGAFDAQKE